MGKQICSFYAVSQIGEREENEDSYEVLSFTDSLFVIVADGLGAHGNGKLASAIAVQSVKRQLSRIDGTLSFPEDYSQLVKGANDEIRQAQSKSVALEQMRTTFAMLHVFRDQAVWLHCGDSRVYHIRDNEILHVTSDHSVAQMAVTEGSTQRSSIPNHPDRNRLTRSLGGLSSESKARIVSTHQHVQSGDRFLLCSDGWWEQMDENTTLIAPFAGSVGDWVSALLPVEFLSDSNGDDNRTAVGIFIR